jgi:anhydro-N-acetylmuramic acid kinase
MNKFHVIGLMSGTSLDGTDIASCTFINDQDKWKFSIDYAETFPYSPRWKQRLSFLMNATALDYVSADAELGNYFGKLINAFIKKHQLVPDLIASHGHTIFHQPDKGFTSQIGHGSQIAAITACDVICDFRSKDIALHGQGAPLVPGGEKFLFSEYHYLLNLGGIANISHQDQSNSVAYDIAPCNMLLNYIVAEKNLEYDENGSFASTGKINQHLLSRLQQLDFYLLDPPKSLGREWFEKEMKPLLQDSISTEDKLSTACMHIAMQIGKTIELSANPKDTVLITGGGAHNKFLIDTIKTQTNVKILLPDKMLIDYKEALIFAFLGLLFKLDKENVMSDVTGCSRNHIGGALYKGK